METWKDERDIREKDVTEGRGQRSSRRGDWERKKVNRERVREGERERGEEEREEERERPQEGIEAGIEIECVKIEKIFDKNEEYQVHSEKKTYPLYR